VESNERVCLFDTIFAVLHDSCYHTGSHGMHGVLLQAKISSDPEQYMAAPAGVQFHEVTAGGLVKVNSSGSLTDTGSMSLAPTKATFSLAAAMHAVRDDVKSVIFLCNPSAVSVSFPVCLQY